VRPAGNKRFSRSIDAAADLGRAASTPGGPTPVRSEPIERITRTGQTDRPIRLTDRSDWRIDRQRRYLL